MTSLRSQLATVRASLGARPAPAPQPAPACGVCEDRSPSCPACRPAMSTAARLELAGVPAEWARLRWEGAPPQVLAMRPDVERAFEARHTERGALLIGATGRGKTGAICSALAPLVAAGVRVRFTVWIKLLRALKESYSGEGPSADAILERLLSAPVVVLDDVGREERITDHSRDILSGLLIEAEAEGRFVVVTSNLPVSGARSLEQYGPRVCSHLGGYQRIAFDGADLRRRGEER